MTRTLEQDRELFKAKAHQVQDQAHFDLIMHGFPDELREEIYAEVLPLLREPKFVLNPRS